MKIKHYDKRESLLPSDWGIKMKIARVFPRKTTATPMDDLCFFDVPPTLLNLDIDEVHVSAAFTYDKPKAEWLADQWNVLGIPVKVGGPAYNDRGDEFIPGMYLKKGYTITSRGCIGNCWFCRVPKVEGSLRELPIKDGYIIQDNNLLACSREHIEKVIQMLNRQPERAKLTGGLEPKLLKDWHVELLQQCRIDEMFFAYDTPDDYEPLIIAGKMLNDAGFTLKSRKKFCYVLIGYKNDTFEKAQKRLTDTLKAGFLPYAMLYKDDDGNEDHQWRKFQRQWARPAIIVSSNKEYFV